MASPTTPSNKVLSPSKLAHIVLRTNNFSQMTNYYTTFLGGHTVFANEGICFITYDEEHHRIAIINIPHLANNPGNTSGLEHIAFTFDNLKDLCTSYKQRKELGITPGWCVVSKSSNSETIMADVAENHGPTTSMYYKDPDGNSIEVQVDNFSSSEEATNYMTTKEFESNTLGADFDPEELCQRVEAGEEEDAIIKMRKDVGVRGMSDIPNIRKQMEKSKYTHIRRENTVGFADFVF